jgi:ferredoxin-NADP reductase
MGASQSQPNGFLGCEVERAIIAAGEAKARAELMEQHSLVLLAKGVIRIIEKTAVSHNTVAITFSIPSRLKLVPGGHVRITGKRFSRNYTPFKVNDASFSIAVKRYEQGDVSSFICDSKVGDFLRVAGPLEPFFTVVNERFDVLWLVGGGTGIAPMYSMARYCAEQNSCSKIVLIGCFRDGNDTILGEEMKGLSQDFPGLVESHVVLSRSEEKNYLGMNTFTGRFCAAHAGVLPKPTQAVVCGPPGFDRTIVLVLETVGLPEDRVGIL